MAPPKPVVFLMDVDNTLLDNDKVAVDVKRFLDREVGRESQERFFATLEDIREQIGYTDYLASLQRYRLEYPHHAEIDTLASFLVDYPFANRLHPGSLDVLERLRGWGPVVLFSDGDVVFQPRKIECSGLFDAVERNVLIYIHKEQELEDVERRYPAERYVLVDDKLRILTAVKRSWGERVRTVFVRQGHYARAPEVARCPRADVTIERIGNLLEYNLAALLDAPRATEEP